MTTYNKGDIVVVPFPFSDQDNFQEHSRFFVTVYVIGAKQHCQGLILLYVSLKHGRSHKKPGMCPEQPHKGMKAARDVTSLSTAGGGLRGWNCLRRDLGGL